MRIRRLHEWDIPPSAAVELQRALRSKLSLKDSISLKKLSRIAGADVSYARDKESLYGAVVVLSLPALELLEERWARGKVSFPYIPGLLSFREAPILLEAFSHLRQVPDAVIFDGQGIAHPRGLGLASHMGLILDLPSVGCAKTRLVGEYSPAARKKGSFSRLEFEGRRVGTVLRTKDGVKPVFISPGHRISLGTATRLVLACCRRYRLPEPIRMAHQLAERLRREGR